jgi:dipeptidyl aminopeptidase/acylaminoacyl peptidase
MFLSGRAQEAPAREHDGIRHYLDEIVRAEDIARCSPLHVARDIMAPTLLLHGDRDTQVPIAQSEALIAANPDIRLRRVAGGDHGLWQQSEELWPEVLEFIDQHLTADAAEN